MKFATIAILATSALAKEDPVASTMRFDFNSTRANITETVITNPDTNSKVSEMRSKYGDYFAYAFSAKNITTEEAGNMIAQCSTAQECADSNSLQKCCVHTTLHHKATDTQDIQYRCMTKSVVNGNMDIELGDFRVQMKCLGNGATYLAGVAMGAAAVMTTLY